MAARPPPHIQKPKKITPPGRLDAAVKFLEALRRNANIGEACAAAGVNRMWAHRRKKADPDFADAWAAAEEDAADRIRSAYWSRGVDGYEKPIVYQGEVTGTVTEVSDMLLRDLARAKCPEFRQSETKPLGQGEASITLTLRAEDAAVSPPPEDTAEDDDAA